MASETPCRRHWITEGNGAAKGSVCHILVYILRCIATAPTGSSTCILRIPPVAWMTVLSAADPREGVGCSRYLCRTNQCFMDSFAHRMYGLVIKGGLSMAGIRSDVQVAVDQYLELYVEAKKIEKKLDALRQVIEAYMKENGLDRVDHTDGRGHIQLTVQERPIMTSRYTTYDAGDIASLLPPNVRKKCIVEVIDKEKLEALEKLGEVSEEVLSRKQTKSSVSWVVRYQK